MVLCYTDAFSEAEAGNGKILGVDGLLSIVNANPSPDATGVLAHVMSSLRSLSPANLQKDDATLLLFRANGQRSTFRDNVLAPFRLLRRASDQSRIVSLTRRGIKTVQV